MNTANAENEEIKRRFAKLVRYHRLENFGWTQQKLADICFVAKNTIQDIEGAKKRLDRDIVEILANAFGFTGSAREGFYLAAGLISNPPVDPPIDVDGFARNFFKNVNAPAAILDRFSDFKFINSYMLLMFNYSLASLPWNFFHSKLGANSLRFFFDPRLQTKNLFRDGWKDYVLINTYLFQEIARPFIEEARYQEILQELQIYEDFDEIWKAASEIQPEQAIALSTLPATLFSEEYEKLTYRHLKLIVPPHLEDRCTALFYLPADDTTKAAFERILNKDKDPKVYRFTNKQRQGFEEFSLVEAPEK